LGDVYKRQALGFGKIIADLVLPMMSGTNIFVMIAVIWIICAISHFALSPMAVYATFTLAFTQIGMTLGINPFAVFYTIQAAGAEVIFPYQWALLLFYVSFGLIATKDFMKICGIKMAMSMVFMMVVVVPYWLLIGLV
ncbi:MAG: SLC13 family permease, partial [Eubacterium sp.]|nr:SLC13 family permease [Eubacterium sp.]